MCMYVYVLSGTTDNFCYDFTYGLANGLGCDSGVCTAPVPFDCSQSKYTQSVAVTGNRVLATYTPLPGIIQQKKTNHYNHPTTTKPLH